MIIMTLPDGTQRSYEKNVTGLTIAQSIGTRLAQEAVVMKVDGHLKDLSHQLEHNADIQILTKTSPEALEILRHDTAHVLAEAVKDLYPKAQITIGPAIENGFYYDIYYEHSFTPEDLNRIEARMRDIIDGDTPFVREVWTREVAIDHFKSIGELFKAELISSIPEGEEISLYRQGNFLDLCRGPHMPSTGKIGKAFKLMKLAGAYWRGDHRNPMLQRIYGTVWPTEKQLQAYLTQLAEAEKRDHRKLGREMDLFHVQEDAPGAVFWHPKGWTLYRGLQDYIRKRIAKADYVEVNTPILVDRRLWEASGHWEKFREAMFTSSEDESRTLVVKPMNCPCHVQIFKQGAVKSYRDLPLRMAEFGACHRNEPSGSLHGIMRVRSFVQDDAHIFCTEDQIISETKIFCDLLQSVYKDLGFDDVQIKFSTRPDVRAGSDDIWDKAEQALRLATEATGLPFTINPGEGAFYGPKLEFVLRDAIGRDWQCGTFQVDFVLPERLGALYTAEDGTRRQPVMLHRAILGSLERFTGVLIEHFSGKFPLWLSPIQVVVATITSDANAFAQEVFDLFKKHDIRVALDVRNEKINYKIRELSLQKTPYIFVIGKREAEQCTVAVRKLGSEGQEILNLQEALAKIQKEAENPADLY